MNINKIQNNIINFSTHKSYKKKNKPINQKQEQNTNFTFPSNPKYYQVTNRLNFKGNRNYIAAPLYDYNDEIYATRIHIPFDYENSITLTIEKEDGADLFLKNDDSIDNDAVDFFVDLYKELYPKRKGEFKKHKATVEKILLENKRNNVVSFNPEEDVEKSISGHDELDGDEWLKAVLNGINDRYEREAMALKYLEMIDLSIEESVLIAAQEVIAVMKLSKTDNSFDVSDIDKKLTIAQKLTRLGDEVSNVYLDCLIQYQKATRGEINLDSILNHIEFMEVFSNQQE